MSERRRERLLAELPSLLGLEKIEENLFVGRNQDLGFGALFGGAGGESAEDLRPARPARGLRGSGRADPEPGGGRNGEPVTGARAAAATSSNWPETDVSPVAGGSEGVARARLRASAAALFSQKGYAAVSVREIVSAAEVTAPTLYYHFGSKEGLYRDLLRGGWEEFERAWLGAVAGGGGPRERLHRLLETALGHFRKNGGITRLLFGARHGPRQGIPSFDSESYHARFLAEIQRLLGEDARPGAAGEREVEAAGLTVAGALSAVVLLQLRHPEQAPGPETLARVADVVLQGLSACR